MGWFYLSYATPAEFLGAAVVEADDLLEAVGVAAVLGIAPEYPPPGTFDGNYDAVLGGPMSPPSAEFCNRLLTEDDVMRMDGANSN